MCLKDAQWMNGYRKWIQCTHTHIHAHTHIYIHVHSYIHIHAYIHIHIHTYMHTHRMEYYQTIKRWNPLTWDNTSKSEVYYMIQARHREMPCYFSHMWTLKYIDFIWALNRLVFSRDCERRDQRLGYGEVHTRLSGTIRQGE